MASKALEKYLIADAIERVVRDFRGRGYRVSKDVKLGGRRADLIVRGDSEEIVFEFKVRESKAIEKEKLRGLQEYVRQEPHRRLQLVLVTPPKNKEIEVLGLDAELEEYLRETPQKELDVLSTHTRLVEVGDLEITRFTWNDEIIEVEGIGLVTVSLQFGSDKENDSEDEILDSYPLKFAVALNSSRELQDVRELEIDTSSFYD